VCCRVRNPGYLALRSSTTEVHLVRLVCVCVCVCVRVCVCVWLWLSLWL
jgi:hypothetical protein